MAREDSQITQHELEDREEQALESGEPSETGRSHGKVIDPDGLPAGQSPGDARADNAEQDWESGRQQADQ